MNAPAVPQNKSRLRQEVTQWAKDFLKQSEGALVCEAALQLAAIQLCDAVRTLDPRVLHEQIADGDVTLYLKVLASLLQISDGLHEIQNADSTTEEPTANAKPPGLTPEQLAGFRQALREL